MSGRLIFFVVALMSIVVFSCGKPSPQLPSNKGETVESKEANVLLQHNLQLAQKEDSILKHYVSSQDVAFSKSELGFWYRIQTKTQGSMLHDKDSCRFLLKLSLMDAQVVREEERSAVLGRKELLKGLEEGLKLMHKGEKAMFIIPWYLAYGRKGNGAEIPPYTSICCQVDLYE